MPQTTPEVYTPRQHISESWSAMRVARRLVARHGFAVARDRAVRQKRVHALALNYGAVTARTSFWIIFWDLVAVNTARVPEPARHTFAKELAA